MMMMMVTMIWHISFVVQIRRQGKSMLGSYCEYQSETPTSNTHPSNISNCFIISLFHDKYQSYQYEKIQQGNLLGKSMLGSYCEYQSISNCWDRDDDEISGKFLFKKYIDILIYIDDNTDDNWII